MLKMREKIHGEKSKYFHFGACYISDPFASSVKASRYSSRIRFAAASMTTVMYDFGLGGIGLISVVVAHD